MIDHARPERHAQILAVFSHRHEAGVIAVRDLLYARRAELNRQWPNLAGDERGLSQGEARGIDRLIRIIETGPTTKSTGEAR